jgi:hypothetical protein
VIRRMTYRNERGRPTSGPAIFCVRITSKSTGWCWPAHRPKRQATKSAIHDIRMNHQPIGKRTDVSDLVEDCRRSRTRGPTHRTVKFAWIISALIIGAPAAFPRGGIGESMWRVDRDELCVTNGIVSAQRGGTLAIDTPSSRAVVRNIARSQDQVAEIRFRYLGPSQASKPLASGELRRQIGLKLEAEDACNLVYAMWHIEPDTRVAISVKHNAGQHTSAQCGAGGYVFLNGQPSNDPTPMRIGEANILRAELHGADLTVTTNGKLAWRGVLGTPLPAGPMGFRTDNVRAVLEYYVGGTSHIQEQHSRPDGGQCAMSADD